MTNHPNRSRPLRESNAELLAALKEMVSIYWDNADDGIRPEPACILRARAAIAHAEGRS
jgi:hypothetical protein